MSQQSTLILLCCVLVMGIMGCKRDQRYKTAPAPPTITDPPPRPMRVARVDEDEDEDDSEDLEDDSPAAPSRDRLKNLGRGAQPGTATPMGRPAPPVRTINGHPKGPTAAVFNAVTNNAVASSVGCFAGSASRGAVSVVVRMTVGNSGAVKSATAVSGARDPALRRCLCDVVKRLTFPPFEGPEVTRSIPFTAVSAPAPR